MKVALILPPMSQLNSPYPSLTYLGGFLREEGYETTLHDFSLELALKIFSKSGLSKVLKALPPETSKADRQFIKESISTIEPLVHFLQGRDSSLAYTLSRGGYLPLNPRLRAYSEDLLLEAFGDLGTRDYAIFMGSLHLDHLQDLIQKYIDPHFQIAKYGDRIVSANPSFDSLHSILKNPSSLPAEELKELTHQLIESKRPDVIALTVPFPGNVLGAFLIAKFAKEKLPHVKVVLGGGFANTELRSLSEPRVFEFVDSICLDQGEEPLLKFLKNSQNTLSVKEKKSVIPTTQGLPIQNYLSLAESLNPMHRLWSDGFWNKLMMAYGCYWKKCTFCDTSLSYIGEYQPSDVNHLITQVESLLEETGHSGFHFVDEAAPPNLIRAFSRELIRRNLKISWWGNIRFEKSFDQELCELMSQSGCIAITGGLEVASNRLLQKMKKGITIEQTAQVTHAFSQAGIMVHAYLMYGFPTQTEAELIDGLEIVRQLFQNQCLHSAFWHRFTPTIHSPEGRQGLESRLYRIPEFKGFAQNDLENHDPMNCIYDRYEAGLQKALFNYQMGLGLDRHVKEWFDFKVPKTKHNKNFICSLLSKPQEESLHVH